MSGEEFPRCAHENRQLTRRVIRGGAIQFVRQCTRCGSSENKPIPHDVVRTQRLRWVDWDDGIEVRYREEERRFYDERESKRRADWQEWYGTYLRSAEWASKRRAVLKRCGGTCEGCAISPATIVHHLTYANVGDELLFQLVGLCEPCHDKAHKDDE